MKTKSLSYRVIVSPDMQTGNGKCGYTAYCPTLGVADDGSSIEEALGNLNGAINAYVASLVEDGEPIPVDRPEFDMLTITQIQVPSSLTLVA